MDSAYDCMFYGPEGYNLAFGTWALGESDWGPLPAQDAKAILRRAWERGFRHFDLAESYGNGRAEQLLGQELRHELRMQREDVKVATKSVVRPPASLRRHIETSLRRMQIEYVDLFYIHWPREGISLPAAVEELARLRDAGMLRRIGVCNLSVSRNPELLAAGSLVDVLQFGYSALWRQPEEQGLVRAGSHPIRVAYSPLAQGLLARRWPQEPAWHPMDHRPRTPLFAPATWNRLRAAGAGFVEHMEARQISPAAAALTWCLQRVDAAVVGARSLRQVDTLTDGLASAMRDPRSVADALSAVDPTLAAAAALLPRLPNMFGYVPAPCRGC